MQLTQRNINAKQEQDSMLRPQIQSKPPSQQLAHLRPDSMFTTTSSTIKRESINTSLEVSLEVTPSKSSAGVLINKTENTGSVLTLGVQAGERKVSSESLLTSKKALTPQVLESLKLTLVAHQISQPSQKNYLNELEKVYCMSSYPNI
jgi:hypothetical protein